EGVERRLLPGVGDEHDVERGARHGVDGQAHAVDADRALRGDVPRELGRRLEGNLERGPRGRERPDLADAVDVPADDVASETCAQGQRALEVPGRAERERSERGPREGLARSVDLEDGLAGSSRRGDRIDREADALDRDRLTESDWLTAGSAREIASDHQTG